MTDRAESNPVQANGTERPEGARPRTRPVPTPRMVLCPFCGGLSADLEQCSTCKGRFDPLSRQASQNAMGPWFIRNESNSFAPGCSYETIRTLIARGRIQANTIVRGPTTNQFWTLAKRAPSIANLLGVCHNCQARVEPRDYACGSCGAPFSPEADRQHMGLAPLQHLPGQAPPAVIAALSGPPLGVEPIEVARFGQGSPARFSGESPDDGVPKTGAATDTRLWIVLATGVIVLTILGAVFGPDLARSLGGPGDAVAERPVDRTGRTPAGQGVRGVTPGPEVAEPSAVSSPSGMASARDPVESGALDRLEEILRTDTAESLETALDLLRTSPSAALPAAERRRVESVVERRLLRSRLRSLP